MTSAGNSAPLTGMFRELIAIHTLLRRDLRAVRRLADEALAGLAAETVLEQVREMETNSPLWRLKFGCLHYCQFVHGHHTLEDVGLFPLVRRHDPSLSSMVDRLEADHRAVHEITERIAAIAREVGVSDTAERRADLVAALSDLEQHLLGHLALEEETLGPLLSGWDGWPGWG